MKKKTNPKPKYHLDHGWVSHARDNFALDDEGFRRILLLSLRDGWRRAIPVHGVARGQSGDRRCALRPKKGAEQRHEPSLHKRKNKDGIGVSVGADDSICIYIYDGTNQRCRRDPAHAARPRTRFR